MLDQKQIISINNPEFSTLDSKPLTKYLNKNNYKKIQLIYPSFLLETGKDNYKSSSTLPPLGILYVAGEVEKAGYQVNVVDAEAEKLDDEAVFQKVKLFEPDLVGIYCTIFNFKRLLNLAEKIKKEIKCPIFFGGPHPTAYWDEVAAEDNVDIVFIGEAEKAVPEVLQALKNNGIGLNRVKGIAFKYNKYIIKTEDRPFLKNLDELAFPAFHLADLKKYRPAPQHARRMPSITMITSRGCPFRCSFCEIPAIFKNTYRKRSVDNVIAEIKLLQKNHGIKDIFFFDDLFGVDKKWLEEFINKLIEEKIDLTWTCLTRIDTLYEDLVFRMKKAGCWSIFFGMESLDNDILKAINKKLTVEQIENAIKICKKAGIQIRANFILGCPNETPEIAKKMIKRLCQLNPDYAKFQLMTPYLGTPIYDQIKQGLWGKMVDEDYTKMTKDEAVFVPYGYKNAKELEDLKNYAFRKFYFRPKYIFSRLISIRSLYDIKRYWLGFKIVIFRYLILKKDI